jgi:hypothetical protein
MTTDEGLRKVKVKKRYRLGFNWFFWISLIVIIIPVIYFVWLLLQAAKVSHTPIVGDRIKNTITYQIDDSTVKQINDTIKTIDGVESVQVNLIVETLRITVNAADGRSAEEYQQMAENIYHAVNGITPIDMYFTRTEEYKQYDLEINVYDNLDADTPIMIALIKNSSMETFVINNLSEPINPELAYQLTHPEEAQQQEEEEQTDEDIEGDGTLEND